MLRDGVVHHDLGADHFDRIDPEAVVKRNVRRLERLGYHVSLQPMAS
jgi:transposase